MKKLSIMALLAVAACQPSSTISSSVTVLNMPASDAADSLDFTKLPDGFPVIAEMVLPVAPARCGLSKLNRMDKEQNVEGRHVFTYQGEEGGQPLYQVGINGVVRTFTPTDAADMDAKKVRYFKTVDAPEVEIMVVLEAEGSTQNSILGRVKAWDAGVPLMCAYNRIEVEGDCDL